jgi:hypothetical protein
VGRWNFFNQVAIVLVGWPARHDSNQAIIELTRTQLPKTQILYFLVLFMSNSWVVSKIINPSDGPPSIGSSGSWVLQFSPSSVISLSVWSLSLSLCLFLSLDLSLSHSQSPSLIPVCPSPVCYCLPCSRRE